VTAEKKAGISFPPRHGFKDIIRESGIKEISFPYGRTIITASVASHKDPHNKYPEVDFFKKENAVWFTLEKEAADEIYDFIIGPDGKFSPIAIKWVNEKTPEFYIQKGEKMERINGIEENKKALVSAGPNDKTAFIHKRYPEAGFVEFYAATRLSGNRNPNALQFTDQRYSSFATKETLISGINNRGFSRLSSSFWAIRATDESNLPFGRDLHK